MGVEQKHRDVSFVITLAAATIHSVVSILALLSILHDWWIGDTSGKIMDVTSLKAEIGLWSYDMTIEVDSGDVALGEQVTTDESKTWSAFCDDALRASAERKEPDVCFKIRVLQGFSMLTTLFAFVAAVLLWVSLCVSPLIIIPSMGSGFLGSLCAVIGLIVTLLIGTEGLQGVGFICFAVATVLVLGGVAVSLAAASKAMPEPPEPPPPHIPREQRAEMARNQAMQEHTKLETDMWRRGQSGSASHRTGSRPRSLAGSSSARSAGGLSAGRSAASGSAPRGEFEERQPPAMLSRVLFWNRNQAANGEDIQDIPTEMLEMAFQEIDEDNSGFIVMDELVSALELCGLHANPTSVDRILKDIDKNSSGDIDIHEFVEFFRQLEELSRFQQKGEARAQFCSILCNVLFLVILIVVFVMTIIFVRIDEEDDPEGYQITRTVLIALIASLVLLFCFVIAIPASRLSIGKHAAGWQAHYHDTLSKRNQLKPVQAFSGGGSPSPSPAVAWEKGAESPTVNATMVGNVYRGGAEPQALMNAPMKSTVTSFKAKEVDMAPPGAILDIAGGFDRYNPDAYSMAAMRAMEGKQNKCFNPMQVRDVEELMVEDQPMGGGLHALADNPNRTFAETPWTKSPSQDQLTITMGSEDRMENAQVMDTQMSHRFSLSNTTRSYPQTGGSTESLQPALRDAGQESGDFGEPAASGGMPAFYGEAWPDR